MTKKQNELDEELLYACGAGDCKKVKRLIKKGANPNCAHMQTPLIEATWCQDVYLIFDTVKVLIEHGADPNVGELKGKREPDCQYTRTHYVSPLLWINNRIQQNEYYLLGQDHKDKYVNLNLKVMEYLLKNKADPNIVCSFTLETALLNQIKNRYFALEEVPVIKLLLKYGASLEIKDKEGHDSMWHLRNHPVGPFKLTGDNNIVCVRTK